MNDDIKRLADEALEVMDFVKTDLELAAESGDGDDVNEAYLSRLIGKLQALAGEI